MKAFCVLEFAKTESIVTVQRRFRTMYHTEPPTDKTIREWYRKFQQSGCLCPAKRTGRPELSKETVERVRETFLRSPQKSTHRASRELQMPQSSVWRILRKRLRVTSCKVGQKLGVSVPLLTCPLRRDHPRSCTAEVRNPGGTYELLCIVSF